MIAKVVKGSRTYGLLKYLYGPGRREEHINPHLVASWDGHETDPAAEPEHMRDAALYALAQHLDRPVDAYTGKIGQHVWHTSVRLAPGDPLLSDAQWGQIARRLVLAGGLAPDREETGCRWVAVRHADDHIHIVATLVRQGQSPYDAKQPDLRGDFYRLREECRRLEHDFGIRVTAEADRTAAPAPKRGERAKANRLRSAQISARETLQAQVRPIALEANNEEDFFTRLNKAGLLIRPRRLPSGDVGGYAVALPGDVSSDGSLIWYSGSRLAPDLTLPRVRQRWTTPTPEPGLVRALAPDLDARSPYAEHVRVAAWQEAATAIRSATAVLQQADNPHAAATTAALADLLTVAASRSPAPVRRELELAARQMERLGREPWQKSNQAATQMRRAIRSLLQAGHLLGYADENAAVLGLAVATVLAVRALRRRMAARHKHAHARVARLAGEHLQHAAELLGARSAARADHAAARRPDLQQALRRAVEGRADADAILRGRDWPALAGMLSRIERLGHDAAAALADVVAQQPLRHDSSSPARRDTQVILWRLENWVASRRRAPTDRDDRTPASRDRPWPEQVQRLAHADNKPAHERRMRALLRGAMHGSDDLDRIFRDPAWPRLVAVLTEIGQAGHDVEGALRSATSGRRLREDPSNPAHSVVQMLTGRLRRLLEETETSSRSTPRAMSHPYAVPSCLPHGAAGGGLPSEHGAGRFVQADDDRVFQRAVVAVVETQTCSPQHLEQLLWVRPARAKDLVRLLCERGVVAVADGGYSVQVGADQLSALRDGMNRRSARAARLASSTSHSWPVRSEKPRPPARAEEMPPAQRQRRSRPQ
ncbi:relaxase/mobilization nuclease domain-containing protein [Nonomuraea ceibae]|uniref:relaxase/mobilization nuclease domain-containing protein n=1 Tax=Nonomuraea ceibae TaxID=1935170 RepID=UPI001C5DFFD6|nr:relaxase/mobilization nuclease domain-containing protein [Nonomuraea ceibae]